ncbi:hypothetical protein HDU96_011083 [Phlyctochytrium bullatum]|nr:hypothetical protein HDU96_011083 [Phlyctochytrium bullatum]
MAETSNRVATVWNAVMDSPTTEDTYSDISESESEHSDEEFPDSLDAHIALNQKYLDGRRSSWRIERYRHKENMSVVHSPTASKIHYKAMHPLHYRHEKVGVGLRNLNELAAALGAPDDWEDQIQRVKADPAVLEALDDFQDCSDDELVVESLFQTIVTSIKQSLARHVLPAGHLRFAVCGLLVDTTLIVLGATDTYWKTRTSDGNDRIVLATEMKTKSSWQDGELWYRSSRGIQVRAALYSSEAPTILLSPDQFKLFLPPSDQAQSGWTYPAGVNVARSEEIISVLSLLFMSRAELRTPREPPVKETTAAETPKRKAPKDHERSTEERLRTKQPSSKSQRKAPRQDRRAEKAPQNDALSDSDSDSDDYDIEFPPNFHASSLVWLADSSIFPTREFE